MPPPCRPCPARQRRASATPFGEVGINGSRVPPPGADGGKRCPRRFPALPRLRSFLAPACAAWLLLRDRLTLRPAAAGGKYRFGFRQNKLGQLVGKELHGQDRLHKSILNPVSSRSNRVCSRNQPCGIVAAWVSGVSGWASPIRERFHPGKAALKFASASCYRPPPAPALGRCPPASAIASPPRTSPTLAANRKAAKKKRFWQLRPSLLACLACVRSRQ